MVYEFKFPDVGEGITEGTIVKWKIKEGDKVESDQILAEVETDKAVVEIPSPKKGTILKLYHNEGDSIYVGEVLAVIGEKGEKVPPKKERYTGSVVGFVPESMEEIKSKQKSKAVSKPEQLKIIAAPKIRKLASDLGVDLMNISGTGAGGKITEDDVKQAAGQIKTPTAKVTKKYDMFGYVDRVPMRGIRKVTALKMREAVSNTALVTHQDKVDVTDLNEVRERENKAAKKEHLTYLPFIIKAIIEALKKHPFVASTVEGDDIIIKKYYNIGVAVDTPEGLMVPVIKGADQKDLYTLAKEINVFVEKAQTRKIDLMDLKGGVFTITNIGVIGSTYFTPIVNYPETCILGTGRVEDMPVVRDGKVVVRKIMPISFTYDHRVLDGAEAARFMNDLKALLETPEKLIK